MSINIFDVEPLTIVNPVHTERVEAFSRWWATLPDGPGSITLRYGLLDSMPHSYAWTDAPAGDMITVHVEITDFLRNSVIGECDDSLFHPEAVDLCNEPGFFNAGQQEAISAACLHHIPAMQTSLLSALFEAVDWDVETWLATYAPVVGMDAASQYVVDKALRLMLCGLESDRVNTDELPFSRLLENGILSADDIGWLQSIADNAIARMTATEALI